VDVDADGQSIDGRSPETRRSEQESLPLGDEGGAGAGSNGGPRPSWLETMEARGDKPRAPTAEDGVGPKADGKAEVETTAEVDRDSGPPFLPDDEPARAAPAAAPAPAAAGTKRRLSPVPSFPGLGNGFDEAIEHLREEARHAGRSDAAAGVPDKSSQGPTESESELRERCHGLFQHWLGQQKKLVLEKIAGAEERAAEKLGRISLGIDRFQRLTNELIRLKARYSVRKEEVTEDLEQEGRSRPRGIPTKVYAMALAFLGIVEFFANAPVFGALLPRDPLTERQIRVLTEMNEGWFAGVERVTAQILFRPDAALLAAGVITFLCVLCHFFGSSLRELVMQRGASNRRYTVQGRSALENAVPLVLTSLGIVLVLGVLYQARIDLGEVGEERYTQDMAQVEEYRREAGWLRVDGELLAANEITNRADDLQEAATELREYSQSMARMSFPILLLNLTLVLSAIAAAYFHRRDARREHFNESPFEEERREYIELAEAVASDISQGLADVVRDIRELKSHTAFGPGDDWRSVKHQLESVVTLYRAENGRARGVDPRSLPAFSKPARLDIEAPESGVSLVTRPPEDYERERAELAQRFTQVRNRFNEEASATW
jgi:hypothetical protein